MAHRDERLCEKCKYPLKGMAWRGNCPECGSYFNTRTGEGIAYPDSHAQSAEKVLKRLRTMALSVMFAVGAIVLLVMLTLGKGSRTAYWLVGSVTACLALSVVMSVFDQYRKDVEY